MQIIMTEKQYWKLFEDITSTCYEIKLNTDRLEKALAKNWIRPEKCCDNPSITERNNKMSILWNPDMEAEKQQYVTIYFEWCSNCWTCTWVI